MKIKLDVTKSLERNAEVYFEKSKKAKAKLRGLESCGMICSISELGLANTSTGIMELPDNAPLGKKLREYLNLDDKAIEIELTPNRGDCLSIVGIAHEVAAINKCKINFSYLYNCQSRLSALCRSHNSWH